MSDAKREAKGEAKAMSEADLTVLRARAAMAREEKRRKMQKISETISAAPAAPDDLTSGDAEIADLIAARKDPEAGARAQGVTKMLNEKLTPERFREYTNRYAERARKYLAALGQDEIKAPLLVYNDEAKELEKRYADALQSLDR